MNDYHPDDFVQLAKRDYQKELDLRLSMKASRASVLRRWLAGVGVWMVARGEKLQARYAEALKMDQLEFSHGKAKKARA